MRKLQSIILLYLPTQVIPSKDTLLQFGNAACRIYRSDTQQLKITAQYRVTEFIHSGKLPSSVQLVSAVAISLPFMAMKTLKMQAPCETISRKIYRPALRYQCVSKLGFRWTLGNCQYRSKLCALPTASMFSFVSKHYFDFVFWYLKHKNWIIKQGRRCAYNVTLWRVHVTIAAVQKH
jgi:hypothetical protein